MTTQLDIDFGSQRRDRGMKDTTGALSQFAREQIRHVIVLVSCRLSEFTSEDVLKELPTGVRASLELHCNALGSAIHGAARSGLIEPTGRMAHAQRPEAHKRKITIWRAKYART